MAHLMNAAAKMAKKDFPGLVEKLVAAVGDNPKVYLPEIVKQIKKRLGQNNSKYEPSNHYQAMYLKVTLKLAKDEMVKKYPLANCETLDDMKALVFGRTKEEDE